MDKGERRRIKRAQLRKDKARKEARGAVAQARRGQAFAAADAAADSLARRDFEGAAELAARAAALAPKDVEIAELYVRASARTRGPRQPIAALEHLIAISGASLPLLLSLAERHREAGNPVRARELAAEARVKAARVRKDRGRWLGLVEAIERATANAIATDDSERATGQPVGQGQLFADPPQEPGVNGDVATQAPPRPAPAATRARTSPRSGSATPEARAVLGPATLEIPVTFVPAILGIESLDGPARRGLEEVELAIAATELRDAESFERLLSVERAQGLVRLSHQEETARRVLSVLLGRALLADEVGLGKTVEAGLVLYEYLLRGRVADALVLCPPTLVGQWREELLAKFGITTRSHEDGEFRKDPTGFWAGHGVTVASLATARTERHREAIVGRPWDLVIVDEAHTVKNHRTESYALVEALKSRFLLLLTATPIENRVEELYNLVSLIRPGHLGGRVAFVRRFATAGGQLAEAARGEIRTLLGEIMIRNTRALSGVKLPPRFARTVLVQPGPDEHALYQTLAGALRALSADGRGRALCSLLLQEAGSSPLAARATLERVAADPDLPAHTSAALVEAADLARRVTGSEKARVLLAGLDPAAGPVVVFTRFRGTLDFLSGVLAQSGVAHERLDGDVPPSERAATIERWRASGAVLLSTDVGSEGLNLQFCHRLVNFDLPWNPMRIEQRIGRLHRIGQEHPVEVTNYCLAGSIEERILTILDERINLFELVVGEIEMILGYLDSPRELPELVLDAFAAPTEPERARLFGRIGDGLEAARQRYRQVKVYDEALFRDELGV